MPARRPGQVRDDFTGEPFGSGEGMNFVDFLPADDIAQDPESPIGSFHADRMEIRALRAERAELIEELELAAEQGRLVGMQADRYRQALERAREQLDKFGLKGPKQVGRALITIEEALSA